jgi:hypothetical protein
MVLYPPIYGLVMEEDFDPSLCTDSGYVCHIWQHLFFDVEVFS